MKTGSASDARVSLAQVNVTYGGYASKFGAGGRVGNSRSDGIVVLDANLQFGGPAPSPDYATDIFTINPSTGVLSLISSLASATAWLPGTGTSGVPPSSLYVGNPWYCPTSGAASGAYMLFQAQNQGSNVGTAAQPGSGSDNDVWLYRPPATGSSHATVWKLTNYGISGTTYLGPGVLGPQCSQDSDSNTNTLHIVYGHQLVGPPDPTQSGTASGLQCAGGHGPSDGTCWWFGQWELVYADINFDVGGNPAVACSGCPEPYLVPSSIKHVNPRDVACSPICDITGTGTAGTGNILNITTTSSPLGASIVATGVHLSLMDHGVPGDFYATVQCYNGATGEYGLTCPSSTSIKLSQPVPSTFTGNFEIHNFAVYEPHWYVKNLGDLYLTSNVQPVYHNGTGLRFNVSTSAFQPLNYLVPPYNTGGPSSSVPFDNTTWNEFLTPDPTLNHFMFMSDRATAPANFAVNPEWSDHYLCSGLSCASPVRLTYFNDSGLDYPMACNSRCFPITPVRGAWLPPTGGPTNLQYLTLVEFLNGETNIHNAGALLFLYTVNFPTTELSGKAAISGKVKLGKDHP